MNIVTKQNILYIYKAIVGITFCISAILKLLSIDSFELYIYSFRFIGLNLSYLIARGVICIELILGTALILNILKRLVYRSSLSLLAAFSVFLFFTILSGSEDNCHCFGEAIQLNPLNSIIKNCVLISLLLLSKNKNPFSFKREKEIFLSLFLLITVSVFIISPPDGWWNGSVSNRVKINETALEESFSLGVLHKDDFISGKKIICFYGTSCKYCKLSAEKLSIMQRKKDFEPDTEVIGIFWGSEKNYADFIESYDLKYSKTYLIAPDLFLKITNGKMPVVITAGY